MDAINWLIAANAIIWLGIGGYLVFLAQRQRALALRIKQLEILRIDHE